MGILAIKNILGGGFGFAQVFDLFARFAA